MPNWYGIEGISFEWKGEQNDPLLHYKGYTFNEPDILNALWDMHREVSNDSTIWEQSVSANAINYLEDIIFALESES